MFIVGQRARLMMVIQSIDMNSCGHHESRELTFYDDGYAVLETSTPMLTKSQVALWKLSMQGLSSQATLAPIIIKPKG